MPFIKATEEPKEEKDIVPPDHQLQNTHVETPYVEEILTPEPTPVPTPPAEPEVVEIKQTVTPSTAPVIKIPTKIVLSNDPYKEPIE